MAEIKQEKENPSGSEGKVPNQKELEKELAEYLSKKYGDRIKIITPFVFPKEKWKETDRRFRKRGRPCPRSTLK
jgi:hypothetical protein